MLITELIEEIADKDKPLIASHLADFSQMTADDMTEFKKTWVDINLERRRQIINRLRELAKDNVELNFDLIFKYVLSDSDSQVRIGAIDGLWENEDPAQIQKLINLMESDTSHEVQASAAAALGKFSVLVECGQIRESYIAVLSQTLLKTINDITRPVEVRRRALESVAPLSLSSVRESIQKAYESRDERFVVSAIYAMGRTCDEAWLPVIHKELSNADAEIRYEAANACGEIGREDSVPYLLEHVHDSDIEVRMAVIQSLGKIGGAEAKKGLQRISRDPNQAIREIVEQALSEIETLEDMTLMSMETPGEIDDRRN
jgi:HEAT repeat protein